ncbi:MAG TPA: hypothetical protein VGJ81_10220 [Thermoanaerobaculia bacterium]|jgi:hypothetical protein
MMAFALALMVGIPAARLADRDAPLLRFLGEAMLLGVAICAAVLFAMSSLGVTWSFTRVSVAALLIAIALTLALRPRQVRFEELHWFDLLTVATLAGYALFATIGAPPEIDFIASWGLKGATFAHHGGIDWSFLQNPWYRWDHPDYPPLLPLVFDAMTLASGGWKPETLGWLYPWFAAGLILIIRSLFREELGSPLRASLATAAVAPLAMAPWIGIGEGPLIAYGTAGLLLARRRVMTSAALLLGCAALSKNEGTALLIAAMAGLIMVRRWRDVPRLWPAFAIAAPWYIARTMFSLGTDIASGPVLDRVVARLRAPGELLAAFATYRTGLPLLWIGIAAAVILGIRFAGDEIFALGTMAVQYLFYFGAYFVTEKNVGWHVRWSWERLAAQGMATLAFVAVVLLYRFATVPRQ